MDFDLLTASVQPGDIVKAPGCFLLVITKDRHAGHGFYYARCDFDGNLIKTSGDRVSAANYINHSNMILVGNEKDRCEIVNCRPMGSRVVFHQCGRYEWHLTDDKHVDAYMANLDARYSLFVDASTTEEMRDYGRNEDRNHHSENGSAVDAFTLMFWMRKCRDARLFQVRVSISSQLTKADA